MLDTVINGIPGVLNGLPRSTSVFCSEIVDMRSEYRVYVVNGVVRAICKYRGSGEALDMEVVKKAVDTLSRSVEGRDLTGYGMDFAVMKKKVSDGGVDEYITCLVEVNDGYSLGCYKGILAKDYTDLLIARWGTLVGKTKKSEANIMDY
ncbi:MAG: hypothetical protein Hyperionvirus11_61 [Hyperionvirus sp.]|uniref:ATP-grasp domain-containing protein n=1 Tax=Hyperionvirus sp. TaxID=2487770 RepID=A0A3G5A954_9VIRU|nr:MAG: hypothetical protein Hyperionvirus11_61 [Hyperionvirus sp.]